MREEVLLGAEDDVTVLHRPVQTKYYEQPIKHDHPNRNGEEAIKGGGDSLAENPECWNFLIFADIFPIFVSKFFLQGF